MTPDQVRGDRPAPLIVTALLGKQDHAWFNALRREHYPPERNVLDAHLTLFHQLPPSPPPRSSNTA